MRAYNYLSTFLKGTPFSYYYIVCLTIEQGETTTIGTLIKGTPHLGGDFMLFG
jgi:hypothetical protein